MSSLPVTSGIRNILKLGTLFFFIFALSAGVYLSKRTQKATSQAATVKASASPLIKPGWPKELDYKSGGTVDESFFLASDLNGDNQKEIIASSYSGNVYVWTNKGQIMAGWPKYLGGNIEGKGDSIPAAADLNNDGKKEIAIKAYAYNCPNPNIPINCTQYTKLHLLNINGDEVNSSWPKLGNFTNPVIVDFFNSGNKEIVSYDQDGNKLHIFDFNGKDDSFSLPAGGSNLMSIGDLDGDRLPEIVFTRESEIIVYKNNGTLLWTKSLDYPESRETDVSWAKPTLADIDRDGKLEIILPAGPPSIIWDGKIFVFKNDGTNLSGWPQSAWFDQGNANRSSVAVGDVDNDGSIDLVWATDHGRILVFDSNGTAKNILYGESVYSNFNRGVALADIDNDSFTDILIGSSRIQYNQGAFFSQNYQGKSVAGWPLNTLVFSTPQITDVDNDGKLDIITYGKEDSSSLDKIYIWGLDSVASSKFLDWPMHGFDEMRSGVWINPNRGPISQPTPTLIPNLGKAAYFGTPGTSNASFINKPNNFPSTGDFSLELWLSPKAGSSWFQTIFDYNGKEPTGEYRPGFGLDFIQDQDYKPALQFGLHQQQVNTDKFIIFRVPPEWLSGNSWKPNLWFHVAITSKNKILSLFINGELKGQITYDSIKTTRNLSFISGSGIYYPRGENYQISGQYNGVIDDFRVSNTARFIQKNWKEGVYFKALKTDANTVALWKFENNLYDSGIYRNNGTAIGRVEYVPGRVPADETVNITGIPTPTQTPASTPTPTCSTPFCNKFPTIPPQVMPCPTGGPCPTIPLGHSPQILTTTLPDLIAFQNYPGVDIIKGYDERGHPMTVEITNLPPRLTFYPSSCVQTGGNIKCSISGRKATGAERKTYYVGVKISDNVTTSTYTSIALTVR